VKLHLGRYAQPGPALKEAKIPTEMDLHLHDLRYTCSTW